MAELVASSVLEILFDKLGSETLKQLGLLMGMDKQLEKLRSTLSAILNVLEDAESRQVKEKSLKDWLKKLKDVAYDAEDVLDKFATKAQDKKKKVSSFLLKPVFRYKQAHRIKEILERLDEIAEERSKFHLQERVVVKGTKEDTGVLREETGSFVNESEVYGREEDRKKIVEFLINNSSPSGDDLGVLAIVGMGGLGKTTVAQVAYKDEKVCKDFDARMWVCVSDDFDIKRIGRSIIDSFGKNELNPQDMNSIQNALIDKLRGKRFLLVLDDVWDEDQEKWGSLKSLLRSGAKGSKIIVTTRIEKVAHIMGTVPLHRLTILSQDDCWNLFEERAFGSGGANKTPNLVAIGKDIVKKCGGVPLAARALGCLMRFKKRESEWVTVKDSELWKLTDDDKKNDILPALMLSYNHLPSRLKQCFAYCSIFPKDYEIQKERLVQLWIAEGFIRSSDENTNLDDIGFQYIDELLSRSLLEIAFEYDGVIRKVKMHDLVHDLARSVAGEECSIVDASTGKGFFQSSRYSSFLNLSKDISAILEPLLNQANKLRTFHLISSRYGMRTEEEQSQKLLDVIFSKLKLLRALHLSGFPIKGLPVSVRNLEHLRYLALTGGAEFETLPSCVGDLHNLLTFSLKSCQNLQALPESIGDLHNLLTLDLYYCKGLLSLPSSIGRLTSLQKLNLESCDSLQALPESIGDLHNLLTLDLGGCGGLLSLLSSIGRLTSLQKLNLNFCESLQALPESVSSLQTLEELDLWDCDKLVQLPENTSNMSSLLHLQTTNCHSLTCMPAGIGQLSHLRTLGMYVVGKENQCSLGELGGLNLLEGYLEISNLENVRNVAEARSANLREKHSLRSLKLNWNSSEPPEMQDRDGYVVDFQEDDVLESLQPHTNLEWLTVKGYLGRKFPSWMLESSLPNLVELWLMSSSFRCERLPPFGQLPKLKTLSLCDLKAVKCLGSDFYGGDGAFPLLETLYLKSMPALEEWSGATATGVEIFPSLSFLSIEDCPKLKALPSTFPFVTELWITPEEGLMLSALPDGAFSNLKSLGLANNNLGSFGDLPQVIKKLMASIHNRTDAHLTQLNSTPL